MAGVGVKLNKIYEKHSLITTVSGITYSVIITIAPMILIVIALFGEEYLLGFDRIGYDTRELFSCTVLYIFIFSLIITSILNAVISRFLSDMFYEEKYNEVLPCFYTCLLITTCFALVLAVPFFIHEHFVGQVGWLYILISFIGYMGLTFTFYCMLYLSITKDYGKISLFFFIGIGIGFLTAMILGKLFHVDITVAMLIGMDVQFMLISAFELAQIRQYFTENSHHYGAVFSYFRQYWWLIVSNSLYIGGLYVHNFVFWTTDLRLVIRHSFVCAEPYDMATFLALMTNISETIIFISSVERFFHQRYRKYSEAVIGGRYGDIVESQKRMFQQLANELLEMTRVQFIISIVIFLLFQVFLPKFGMAGLIMEIYPLLAAAYFIMFIMYGSMIFTYYFNDSVGSVLTGLVFFAATLIASIIMTHFSPIWYGAGLLIGALAGWTVCYFRLRWIEQHLNRHIFCTGHIVERGEGTMPDPLVFTRSEEETEGRKPEAGDDL